MRKIYSLLLVFLGCSLWASGSKLTCPTAIASPTSETLCSGQTTNIQLSSNVANTTFTWTAVQTGVTGASNGSGNVISQVLSTTSVNAGQVVYTITPFGDSCSGNPITVTIFVNPVPVVNVNSTQYSICNGSSTNITMSSNVNNTTFYWNVVSSGGVTGATSGTGTSINQVLTTTGTTVGQVVYTITPVVNGCPGTPKTVTVTVYPIPNITASPWSSTLCSGETTSIHLTSNVPGTVFNWTAMPTGVLGATSGSGYSIYQTLTTIGIYQGQVTYTVTPTINGCTGTPISVTVTVNPTPEAFSLTGTSQILCSGESVGILINSNIPGTTFTWTAVQNGVDGAFGGNGTETTPGAGMPINQVLTTTGNTPGTVTYTITPDTNGCTGSPTVVTLTVNPLPELNIPDGLICVDENTNEVLTPYVLETGLSPNDYLFKWHLNNDMNTVIGESSSYSATEAGQYTVTAMNWTSGCTETQTIYVSESSPIQSASAVYHEQFDGNYTVVVTTDGTGSYLYQIDGGELQTSNTFSDITFGQHVIHVTDANGCSDKTVNIDLPEVISRHVAISPNPVTDVLTVQNDQIITKVNVLNHLGQTIMENNSHSKSVELNLSDLNTGIYFIKIESDKTETVKIIKN
ncbi:MULTISPECIES: PKD-like domain-containing protein [Flavobacterium]|uniref:PKD-like domain-containing protein n=1 Tax=Flavobacterium TaxID=237 RepID=UPI001FCAA26E|nr:MULTISPECIES: PKD-like domain-containing protein [Flavobacterium]UOK43886.1 T9SS type A sorting domain-containing protein [Flavobacterium enshiense]